MEAAFWGLAGTVVGALASVTTTFVASRNAAALQKAAAILDRAEKQRSFQRETLLELQDALHDLMRLITQGYLEDSAAFRASGTWGKALLSEEVNEGQRLARRRVLILIERVADDPLRNDLKGLNESLTKVSFGSSEFNAEALFNAASTQAMQVMEHIGKVLRALY